MVNFVLPVSRVVGYRRATVGKFRPRLNAREKFIQSLSRCFWVLVHAFLATTVWFRRLTQTGKANMLVGNIEETRLHKQPLKKKLKTHRNPGLSSPGKAHKGGLGRKPRGNMLTESE